MKKIFVLIALASVIILYGCVTEHAPKQIITPQLCSSFGEVIAITGEISITDLSWDYKGGESQHIVIRVYSVNDQQIPEAEIPIEADEQIKEYLLSASVEKQPVRLLGYETIEAVGIPPEANYEGIQSNGYDIKQFFYAIHVNPPNSIHEKELAHDTVEISYDPHAKSFSSPWSRNDSETLLFDRLNKNKPPSILYISPKLDWAGEGEFINRLTEFAQNNQCDLFLWQATSNYPPEGYYYEFLHQR